ncbi:MAG TPA: zf-HC2 domain-containing protein [Acidimicrobiia bacterium]
MTHLGEMLSAFLDGELTHDEERRVTEHLGSCEFCAEELADLHQARALVRSLPILDTPGRLLHRPDDGKVVPLYRRPRAWAAAAAAALVILVGLATVLAPSPAGVQVPIEDLSNQFRARDSLDRTFTPIELVPVVLNGAE